jgi:hypothetical protein
MVSLAKIIYKDIPISHETYLVGPLMEGINSCNLMIKILAMIL